jgi:hypothetical protein
MIAEPNICETCDEPFADGIKCACEREPLRYDYDKQAWVENGRYLDCSHPAAMNCQCFGRLHAGELAQ